LRIIGLEIAKYSATVIKPVKYVAPILVYVIHEQRYENSLSGEKKEKSIQIIA
jgi:hypothetical protein